MSDGALSYYHDHFVSTRVSKFTYGYFCHPVFDPAAPDHLQRSHSVYVCASGVRRVQGFFDGILSKVCSFSSVVMCLINFFYAEHASFGDQGIQKELCLRSSVKVWVPKNHYIHYSYRGEVVTPRWEDIDTRKS